jgi:hypothetical protein
MHSITAVIGDDCCRHARNRPARQNRSFSAVFRQYLAALPGLQRANKAFPVSNMSSSISQPTLGAKQNNSGDFAP